MRLRRCVATSLADVSRRAVHRSRQRPVSVLISQGPQSPEISPAPFWSVGRRSKVGRTAGPQSLFLPGLPWCLRPPVALLSLRRQFQLRPRSRLHLRLPRRPLRTPLQGSHLRPPLQVLNLPRQRFPPVLPPRRLPAPDRPRLHSGVRSFPHRVRLRRAWSPLRPSLLRHRLQRWSQCALHHRRLQQHRQPWCARRLFPPPQPCRREFPVQPRSCRRCALHSRGQKKRSRPMRRVVLCHRFARLPPSCSRRPVP